MSFFYPPFNSITGFRVSKMTHYLHRGGHDVRVLCATRDDLLADLPVELPTDRVVRTDFFDVNTIPKLLLGRGRVKQRGFEFGREAPVMNVLGAAYRNLINFPDGQVGWLRPALRAGEELIARWRPDVIVSIASPWTSHLVSRSLARNNGIPWIAEYHDPWTDSRLRGRVWPLSALERRLEDSVVGEASSIVTVSDAWSRDFARRFPSIPVHVVPYGYEPADYDSRVVPPAAPLVLRYTGRMYGRQHPQPLLRAVRALIESKDLVPTDLHVEFVGRYLAVASAAIRETGVDRAVVEVLPPRAHAEVVRSQRSAHILVLLLGDDADVGWRPAKLYEYLGARRPILVIGGTEAHEARRIVLESGAGVALCDQDAIAAQLREWAGELRDTGAVAFRGDAGPLRRFEWSELASVMDGVLRETLERALPMRQ